MGRGSNIAIELHKPQGGYGTNAYAYKFNSISEAARDPRDSPRDE